MPMAIFGTGEDATRVLYDPSSGGNRLFQSAQDFLCLCKLLLNAQRFVAHRSQGKRELESRQG
jgi:hypothetical protein